MTVLKVDWKKDTEDILLLDELKRLLVQISRQNTENMNTLVESLKEGSLKKDESVKTARLTKPAKVPTWTKDIMLET